MIRLVFKPWRALDVRRDNAADVAMLQDMAGLAHIKMRAGMDGPHTGRVYRLRGGRLHRASVDQTRREYPAKRTGALAGSIRTTVTQAQMTIGTSKFYARFLRSGTIKMKRRKMSDDALKAAAPVAWGRKRPFARFVHV